MRLIQATVGPLAAASANNIALSQSPGAGAIILNGALVSGGVATLDTARRVLLTSGSNDSSVTFTVTGTDWNNNVQSSAVVGANAGAVFTPLDFKTVTKIASSSAVAGTLTIGTNGVASSRPVFLDPFAPGQVAVQAVASGTVNYTLQQTLDDPNRLNNTNTTFPDAPVGYAAVNWVNSPDANAIGATGTVQTNYAYAPYLFRAVLNSGTGSVVLTLNQAGTNSF